MPKFIPNTQQNENVNSYDFRRAELLIKGGFIFHGLGMPHFRVVRFLKLLSLPQLKNNEASPGVILCNIMGKIYKTNRLYLSRL